MSDLPMSDPADGPIDDLDLPERVRGCMIILAAQVEAATRALNEDNDNFDVGVSISAQLPGLTITVSWAWDKSGPDIEIT